MIAEIIINSNARALNKIFDYIIPEKLQGLICIGNRVVIPFGKSEKVDDGIVINIKEKSDFANKEIIAISKNKGLREKDIILARLMARKYFCNIFDCVKLMLPPGTIQKDEDKRVKEKFARFIYLNKTNDELIDLINNGKIKSEKHKRLLEFLMKNDGSILQDVEQILDISSAMIKTVEKNEYIRIEMKSINRDPFWDKKIIPDKKKSLNDEQKKCFDKINYFIQQEEYSKNLIFGVTGSRKNRNIFTINRRSFKKR